MAFFLPVEMYTQVRGMDVAKDHPTNRICSRQRGVGAPATARYQRHCQQKLVDASNRNLLGAGSPYQSPCCYAAEGKLVSGHSQVPVDLRCRRCQSTLSSSRLNVNNNNSLYKELVKLSPDFSKEIEVQRSPPFPHKNPGRRQPTLRTMSRHFRRSTSKLNIWIGKAGVSNPLRLGSGGVGSSLVQSCEGPSLTGAATAQPPSGCAEYRLGLKFHRP